jgi:hypothetical protein
MLNRLLLTLLAVFAVSSPALAYPLNSYQVVWAFEGHGAVSAGAPEHAVTGELKFSDPAFGPSVTLTAFADGDPTRISGFVNAAIVDAQAGVVSDSIAGSGGGFYETSSAIPFRGLLRINLNDTDGVALDEGAVDPNGFFLPPSFAPDIAQFDVKQIVSYGELCTDSPFFGSCASGGGLRYPIDTFAITIDRFVDPVPEPARLELGALALIAARLVRRRT